MSEKKLPKGWRVTSIGSVTNNIQYGYTASSKDSKEGIRFLRITDIQDNKVDWENVPTCDIDNTSIKKFKLLPNDLVFARTGATVGKNFLIKHVPYTAVFASYLIRMTVNESAKIQYIKYFFESPSYWKQISENASGIGQPSVNASKLKSIKIPLAPLPEQQRIVAKLDAVFGHLDRLREKLDRIPELLKNFRQQVLTQAVAGELTREWREGIKDRSSSDLLGVKQIKIHLLKIRKIKKSKLEPTKDEEILLSNIPDEWSKTKLDSIFDFIDYRGKTPKKTKSGIRLITAKNIKMGVLSNEPIDYMSKNDFNKWMTRGFPKLGDLFFVTEGATMGNVALNNRTDSFALAQRTLTLHNICDVNTDFFLIIMLSNFFQRVIESNATGTAARGIKAAKFKNLTVPFPSLDEQEVITKKVSSLFNIADKIESKYQSLKTKIDQLPQAVLAKAFRGELVGQEVKEYIREVGELGMVAEGIGLYKSSSSK